MSTAARDLLLEAHSRFRPKAELGSRMEAIVRHIRSTLFDEQLAFIDDPSREKAALCTRRAGKTTLVRALLLLTVLNRPGVLVRFWAITRLRAKQLVWNELKQLCVESGLYTKTELSKACNETELTLWLPNDAEVRLLGADKEKETDKKRGDKCALDIVDEAQLFGMFLKTLVEDVIGPGLMDLRGTVCLMGTPGVVCAGHWFDVTREDEGRVPGWSVHRWSVLDNPFMPHAREELALMKAKRNWADDNPTWLREYCGKWVNDSGALVYRYDDARNGIDRLPDVGGWAYVLGWDLGSGGENDPMALHVWGWTPKLPDLYQVKSWKKPEARIADVMGKVREWERELGGFVRRVADTGGGGKLTVDDVRDRYGIHFEPAKKTEKHIHQTMMNDDFLAGRIKCLRESAYVEEVSTLPRDPEDPTKEDERFANHCADAALYAWREARHFWHEPEAAAPVRGSREAFEAEAAELERQAEERLERELNKDWWES